MCMRALCDEERLGGETDCVYASVEDHDSLLQVGRAAAQTGVATPEALQQLSVHHLPVHLNGHVELHHHHTKVNHGTQHSTTPMGMLNCTTTTQRSNMAHSTIAMGMLNCTNKQTSTWHLPQHNSSAEGTACSHLESKHRT